MWTAALYIESLHNVTQHPGDLKRRTVVVVADPPVLGEHLGFERGSALLAVEMLVTKPAVERFDPGVLRSGIDEDGAGAVVEPQVDRGTTNGSGLLRAGDNPSASMERSVTIAGHSLVNSSKTFRSFSVLPSLVWGVELEVEGPEHVGPDRAHRPDQDATTPCSRFFFRTAPSGPLPATGAGNPARC